MKGIILSEGLLQAYLFNGEDELKRDYVLKRLVERISKLGDLDFNKDTFHGESVQAQELLAACNTLPFMCEYRLVVCTDVDKARKEVQEAIVNYLQSPNETTVLAMSASKLAKNTRLYKAIAKVDAKSIVDCAPKNARDLPAQVRSFATSNKVSMSDAAARELIDLVGDSTVRLNAEIEKMAAALGKNATIGVEEVRKLVVRSAQAKPWHLADAMSNRDAKQVLKVLSRMDSEQPLRLLAICVGRIRELLYAKDFGRQVNLKALAARLKVPDWRVKNHPAWAARFTQKELENALIGAANLESALKTSTGDASILLEKWLLSICIQKS